MIETKRGWVAAICAALFAATLTVSAAAQERYEEEKGRYGEEKEERYTEKEYVKGSVEDLDWLAGHWQGEYYGGIVDEIYTKPRNGTLAGMYRWTKDGQGATYAIMAYTNVGETVVFQMTELNADLTPVKGSGESFGQLLEMSEDKAVFEGMTVERNGPGDLTVTLTLEGESGAPVTHTMRYKRHCEGVCVMP